MAIKPRIKGEIMVEFEIKTKGKAPFKKIQVFLKEGAITIEKTLTEDELKIIDEVRQDYEESKPKCKRCYDQGYTIEGPLLNERIDCGCSRA